MDMQKIIKWAFIFSVFLYGAMAVVLKGAPLWDSPWMPQDETAAMLLIVLGPMAVLMWGTAWVFARMKKPPNAMKQGGTPQGNCPLTRFIIAAALAESGALFGLAISFIEGNSRYAIAFAVPTVIVLFLLSTEPPENGAPPRSGPPPIG